MCLPRSSQLTNLLMLLHIVLRVYQIEINKVDLKLKCVEKEIEKQKGYKTSLTKLLENKKEFCSAVNASVRALDQLIFSNMEVDDYIASFNDSEAKRHDNGDNVFKVKSRTVKPQTTRVTHS